MSVSDPALIDEYYSALVERKSSYVGMFYVGVKTTSIFCIATCRARKPKKENVTFYRSLKEALDAGFRPCKICRPTEHAETAPPEVQRAIELVKDKPKQRIKDAELRAEGIAPESIRRWFKRHYGMTYQAYQRMVRINQAVHELQHGKSATEVALDSGYDSLSGFGYTYKKLLGKSPSNAGENSMILIDRFTTPLGPMFVCGTEKGICLLEFVDRRMLESEFEDLQKRLKSNIVAGENDAMREAKKQVLEYFAGERTEFDLPLHIPGTDFQQQVWHLLTTIPCGETVSYQVQAERLGNPKAVRAVARANGMNRIAIVIPCHRVIGKDGSLVGYAGGLERKKWLLEHEQRLKR